jgi:hypothetical protein
VPVVADPESAPSLREIERWFVRRGVPHFVESSTEGSALDVWSRSLPLLIAFYFLRSLNALRLEDWSWETNVAAAFVVLAIAVATWVLSNRLRGKASFARPTDIDAPELVLFLVGPAVPALLFGQPGDALESILTGAIVLGLIYVWSSYAIGALLRWGARTGATELSRLVPLVSRALPLLLGVNTFLFINAEVWEVAGTLDGAVYVITIGVFVLLGSIFAFSRMPSLISELNRFDTWEEIGAATSDTPAHDIALPSGPAPHDPLRPRQKLNIGLMILFGQALQITLVVVALIGFFVLFGWLAISEETASNWTRSSPANVIASTDVGDRQLVVTEPLLRVAIFLGAFSGMYFTVVLTTDETYRGQIVDVVGPQIRAALAARTAYRVARGSAAGSPRRNDENRDDESIDHGVA